MKTRFITFYVLGFTLGATQAQAQNSSTTSTPTKTATTMNTSNQSTEPIIAFFSAFGKGDFAGIINTFHDNCSIIAVRDVERNGTEIYGTYTGKEGAKQFISNLGNAFETKAFIVESIIGEAGIAFANGKFTHQLKTTGKLYSSDWSLMCKIKEGKIFEYHFYEDTAKFVEASMN